MKIVSHIGRVAVFLALAIGLGGCEQIRKLRESFHPEYVRDVQGNAGLRVDVEPPVGVSILLDGVRVSSVSPYINEHLPAGSHRLEVRAPSYFSITLPVTLTDGEVLKVPVHLRQRPPGKTKKRAKAKHPPAPPAAPAPPRPPPGAIGPPLPPGVQPIQLRIAAQPPGEIRVDDHATAGKTFVLNRVRGRVSVGKEAALAYRIGSRGLLTLVVMDDGGQWFKGAKPLETGASFPLHKGAVRLKRISSTGEAQTILLARL